MIKGQRIFGLIPARGGSKGLPNKNIKMLLGKPLIAWTIEQAVSSHCFDRVVVSTDDQQIADLAKEHGADVPFLRPAELAKDDSPMIDAILHALMFFEKKGELFDILVLLEPTSPLRENHDISQALEQLVAQKDKADALISMGEIHMENPYITKVLDQNGYVSPLLESKNFHQRQQLPKAYFPYGVIYASKVDSLKRERTFYQKRAIPYFIQRHQNYEIDDSLDFACIEAIMKSRLQVAQ